MELMENKYYYKFRPRFEYNNENITIFNSDIEYLEIGFTYLGYIVMNKIYRNSYPKFKLDIKYTINKLIKEFNIMMEFDETFKYIKLDYDIMYKKLESIIKDKMKQYSDLVEEI